MWSSKFFGVSVKPGGGVDGAVLEFMVEVGGDPV